MSASAGVAWRKQIFVSHTAEMRDYPKGDSFLAAAETAIMASKRYAFEMRAFPAGPPSADACVQEVRRSNIYVGLIGFRYGTPVRDRSELSYTELEYETARETGIPRLVFLLDEEAEVPARAVVDTEFAHRQMVFRQRLEASGHIVKRFRTPADLARELTEALNALPPRPLEEPWYSMAQEPRGYVPRPALEQQLFNALRRAKDARQPAALSGGAGFGKTALTESICQSKRISDWFSNGVLWVTIGAGRSPDDLLAIVRELCATLTGETNSFPDLATAGNYLGELLADRKFLIVIDGVCRRSDVGPFLVGAPNCTRLLLARERKPLPALVQHVEVPPMTPDEARDALLFGFDTEDHGAVDTLLARCGQWPLLLRLVNGTLREMRTQGSLTQAVAWTARELTEHGAPNLDITHAAQRDAAVRAAVDVALLAFEHGNGPKVVKMCEELAVFPEGAEIPLSVFETYWSHTAGSDATSTRTSLNGMRDLGLTHRFDVERNLVNIHGEVRRCLWERCADRIPQMNAELLDAYLERPHDQPREWASLAEEARYLWSNLSYHLIKAGQEDELRATVTDLRYLAAKSFYLGPRAAEADLRVTRQDATVGVLHTAFRQAAHLLAGFERVNDLLATLCARLTDIKPLRGLVKQAEKALEPPYFSALWPMPDHPDPGFQWAFTEHQAAVNSVVFDSTGQLALSADADGEILIWDADSGNPKERLTGHTMPVNAAVFDSAGIYVASAGADGTVLVWDAEYGGDPIVRRRPHEKPVNSVAFDPTADRLASASADGTVKILSLDPNVRDVTLPDHGREVNAVAFDPRGRYLVSGSADGTVRIWSCRSRIRLVAALEGHEGEVNAVAVGPDGRWIISGGSDGTIREWDVRTKKQVRAHRVRFPVRSLHPDRGGLRVVVAGYGSTVRIIDRRSGVSMARLDEVTKVQSVAFDSESTRVALAGVDGKIRIWKAGPARPESRRTKRSLRVNDVAMDAHASLAVSAGEDDKVRVWDVKTGDLRFELPGHYCGVNSVAVHQQDGYIVSGGYDTTIRMWDLNGTDRGKFEWHAEPVNCVNVVNNVVVSCAGSGVCVWESGTCDRLEGLHAGTARWVALDRAGSKVATCGDDGIVRVVDRLSGEGLILEGHDGTVNCVAIDHAGGRIVSAGDDGTVRVWDAHQGDVLAVFIGHVGPVNAAVFDALGGQVISVGHDGTVRLWDIKDRAERARLRIEGAALCCSGSDYRLVVGGERGVYLFTVVGASSGPGPGTPGNIKWRKGGQFVAA